ncbi:Uncharacterised protein [Mycobacterium tuberculosis]|uniref:Uncharacterized protein n=1 Tax=Mycobacterium tuberculosis TaxID=1773 RepID=A0A916L7E4_MYCTX|nr:Uncharacterised protein [Mycobacterium tuberculosis]
MPRAATIPSPVCHTWSLTTKTRLSRLADSLRHGSLSRMTAARSAAASDAHDR